MKKIKYEKPTSLDAGKLASVLGQNCSHGGTPADFCINGDDPSTIPYCPNGSVATDNCQSAGSDAGDNCQPTGTLAGSGCFSGATAGLACVSGSGP